MQTPLPEFMLRNVQRLINHGIQKSTTATALCGTLDGKRLDVEIIEPGWSLSLRSNGSELVLEPSVSGQQPDAAIRGTIVSLAGLVMRDDAGGSVRESTVESSGDTDVAEGFYELLRLARPDFEEELSHYIGDVAAHEAGSLARALSGWAGHTMTALARSTGEYLQEESELLPTRAEIEEFIAGVDALANDVARAEMRMQRVRERSNRDGHR